jgi:hypothetical protein
MWKDQLEGRRQGGGRSVGDGPHRPTSSDTASVGVAIEDSASDTDVEVKHQARRGVLAPPGRLPTSTEPLFDLVSHDPSVGKKNELSGIVIRKELEVLRRGRWG